MISERMDTIVRAVAAASSRRSLLGALVGGLLALANPRAGAEAPVEAATKKKKRPRRPERCPKRRRCKRKCCKQGQSCQGGVCRRRGPEPDRIRVRRNLHKLEADGPELRAFAQGVAAMRRRLASEDTSWEGQVRLHRPDVMQHGSFHFLAWHRMYLYWFERIVRKSSGDPTFVLPYWDYSDPDQRVLPLPFRDSRNALYEASRSDPVNDGEEPDEDIELIFDTSYAFDMETFADFGGGPNETGGLEYAPHNLIHRWVGGIMDDIQESPHDPIFWIHHANIDRMWEEWLRRGGGRANPGRGSFLTTTFSFFDEDGEPVEMTGSQILDTVEQLGYRYDDQPASAGARSAATSDEPAFTATERESTVVGATRTDDLRLGPRPADVSIPVRDAAGAGFQAATREPGARTTLALEGVAGGGVAGVIYAVHVGATSADPDWRERSYVGALSLFGVQPGDHAGHGHRAATIRFDATDAIAAAGSDKKITVTLVPVNLTGSDRPPGGTWATIERMVISVEGAATGGAQKQTAPKQQRQRQRDDRGGEKSPERKERQRNADDAKPAADRKRKQRDQPGRTHAAPAIDESHHAAVIPGSKHTAFGRDPADAMIAAEESGHARH